MFCPYYALQYKGEKLVEYKGPSTAAAACVAVSGYLLLILVRIVTLPLVMCRGVQVNLHCRLHVLCAVTTVICARSNRDIPALLLLQ